MPCVPKSTCALAWSPLPSRPTTRPWPKRSCIMTVPTASDWRLASVAARVCGVLAKELARRSVRVAGCGAAVEGRGAGVEGRETVVEGGGAGVTFGLLEAGY